MWSFDKQRMYVLCPVMLPVSERLRPVSDDELFMSRVNKLDDPIRSTKSISGSDNGSIEIVIWLNSFLHPRFFQLYFQQAKCKSTVLQSTNYRIDCCTLIYASGQSASETLTVPNTKVAKRGQKERRSPSKLMIWPLAFLMNCRTLHVFSNLISAIEGPDLKSSPS